MMKGRAERIGRLEKGRLALKARASSMEMARSASGERVKSRA
jgi:hypothetical protein